MTMGRVLRSSHTLLHDDVVLGMANGIRDAFHGKSCHQIVGPRATAEYEYDQSKTERYVTMTRYHQEKFETGREKGSPSTFATAIE